jgi:beta-glucanase (GH16 family)
VAKEAVRLDGKGHLVLTTSEDGDEIQVGMVGTQGKFECKYGFFESRIKFQKLQGHHGAFWLQSPTYGKVPDDPGQSGAEIDIVEFYGTGRPDGGVQTSVHWNPYPKTSKSTTAVDLAPILGVKRTGKTAKAKEISDDFHVFALEWTEKEYRFFIDGLEVFRTSEGLSHRSEYIVLSLISSDWEVARLDRKKLPDSMMVDYVHVYAKK